MPNLPPPPKDALVEIRYRCYYCHKLMAPNAPSFYCKHCRVEYRINNDGTPYFVMFNLLNNSPINYEEFYYLWIDYHQHETGLAKRSSPLNLETDGVLFRIPQTFHIQAKEARKLAARLLNLKAFS